MNALEKYLKKIDESSYDCKDVHTINSEFQQVCKQLFEEGKQDIAAIADLDRQVFSVQKSFDKNPDNEKGIINGLSWQMSGTQTLEDGSQIPLYWPDVTKYTQQDFEYFEKRYNDYKNLYAKTEYGLMVYFGEKTATSKHNDFKRQLCNELFQLSKEYQAKSNKGDEKNHYVLNFFHSLRMAFGVAEKSNLEPELTNLIQYIFETHQNWDITKDGTLRILLDLSGLLSDYFGLSNKLIDFQKVVNKNLEGARELEKTHVWGAMYAIDRNIAIEQKRNKPVIGLLEFKAKLYEKLATDAENKANLACISFAENALRIYQQIKLPEDVSRLEKYYSELRGKFRLSEIKQELSKEHVDHMNERIFKAVSDNNESGIIHHFITSPWYDTIHNIKDRSIELSKDTFYSLFPTSIMDKFGNTVDVFNTDEEKEKYNFWKSYTFNFQIGTQTMHKFFIEAYKAQKLSYASVISYLENTWFNEVIVRNYHGQAVDIKPLDTLKPGLKRLFEELDRFFADNTYQCDFVTVTDSLTLKVEGLLRNFCEKIGIATFKRRPKGPHELMMEKLLDDLLADIAHKPPLKPEQKTNFDEEDRMFIKYVLAEKAGLNLRNAVAHSLMDVFEYSFENVVVLFCIIIKLSKYKFIETKGDTNDNSCK
ncbi:MAG: hypothetical protein A2W91_08535 [Bacteroidetes bacterium GWF2_38_335]|nr:MAG: hypothetical protein A2W91_08535 [Bacteroidetes bacterium GWF2_38_335]OFY80426.1 MAG: hypothetical protein A2281_08260 [Bacteroidetes bacterium RIFOXYA12_FULL_38_20]HBS85975.1 DUF4209 domain-containing protein [Bacteroidales bacterium]